MSMYRNEVGLALNWMMFDSSGHKLRPQGGVLENYYRCQRSTVVKVIVKPEYVSQTRNAHCFRYLYGRTAIDVSFNPVHHYENPDPRQHNNTELHTKYDFLFDSIYIRHYHTKSEEDYARKRLRGDVFFKNSTKYDNLKHARVVYPHNCSVYSLSTA
jgi:hypothetical protein